MYTYHFVVTIFYKQKRAAIYSCWIPTFLLFLSFPFLLSSLPCRKVEMLNDLREYQRRLKEAKCQLEKAEMAEQEARATAHEVKQAMEQTEANMRDHTAASKITISNLQLEIKSMKSK